MKVNIVYGPPGTGKTTNLLNQMVEEVKEGLPRERIGFVSFTRAAANEAANRLGLTNSKTIRTIHSFAYSIVGAVSQQIMDRIKYDDFGERYGYEFTGGVVDGVSQGLSKGDEMLATYNLAMARMAPPMAVYEATHPDYTPYEFEHFVKSYNVYREAYGYMDFNDMIMRCLSRKIDLGVKVLYVDEAQDLSALQWAFINNASRKVDKLVLAGDDDQCIYAWAGAESHGMREYHNAADSNVSVLDQSYRVPRLIYNLSQFVISNIRDRVPKKYAPRPEDGEIVRHGNLDWVEIDPDPETPESVLVLYRNHTSRKEIEQWLMDHGVRFTSTSQFGSPFTDRYANAVRAFKRIIDGVTVTDIQTMARVTCTQYKARVEARDFKLMERLGWEGLFNIPHRNLEYLRKVDLKKKANCILSTIHSAKGMEADRVILYNSMGQRTWEGFNDDEHRVWFVGVTRARNRLDIVEGDNPYNLEHGYAHR